MSLSESLIQFNFDLETCDLLVDLGRSRTTVSNELKSLNFNENVLSLMLDNRRLLRSVLLRLQLYSEKNTSENTVRNNFSRLNSVQVNDLLNYLYSTNSASTSSQENNVHLTTENQNLDDNVDDNVDDNLDEEDEKNLLDSFFDECVTQTEEATDIVKNSEFYSRLTDWWTSETNELPDKKELKTYLNTRLGKSKSNTWSKVCLN